jgi:hypothetical protein
VLFQAFQLDEFGDQLVFAGGWNMDLSSAIRISYLLLFMLCAITSLSHTVFDAVISRLMTSVHSKPPVRIVEDNVTALAMYAVTLVTAWMP